MRIHIATDHAGLEFSTQLQHHLAGAGHDVIDHGPIEYDALDDYPAFCIRAAQAVARDQDAGIEALGVVFGGSGNGEQIAANKVQGIRAALVWSIATAELAREHNDANVIAIGARQHTFDEVTTFIDRFIATPFSDEERHVRRIGQIAAFELDGSLQPDPRAVPLDGASAGIPVGGESIDAIDPEAG
jgi:ribose 5-phosphate isomerase B